MARCHTHGSRDRALLMALHRWMDALVRRSERFHASIRRQRPGQRSDDPSRSCNDTHRHPRHLGMHHSSGQTKAAPPPPVHGGTEFPFHRSVRAGFRLRRCTDFLHRPRPNPENFGQPRSRLHPIAPAVCEDALHRLIRWALGSMPSGSYPLPINTSSEKQPKPPEKPP